MDIEQQLDSLTRMTVRELQGRFAKVFGEQPRGRHRIWLIRRIAWRLQALEYGGLSERARQRAAELANEADLRLTPPRGFAVETASARTGSRASGSANNARLPIPGAQLMRDYKGRTIVVTIRSDGFEFDGQLFASLTAVARAVTGTHWNGYHFFGLLKQRPKV